MTDRLEDGRPTGGGDGDDGADGDDGDGKWACRGDGAGDADDAGVELEEVAVEVSRRPAGGVASRPAGGADGRQCNRTELGDGLADGSLDSETCDADAGLHHCSLLPLLHWRSCTEEAADRDCRGCLGREPPLPPPLRPPQQPSTTNSTEVAS